jgi:hypothetical protein
MGGVVKADGGGHVDYHHAILWEMVWKAMGLLGYVLYSFTVIVLMIAFGRYQRVGGLTKAFFGLA